MEEARNAGVAEIIDHKLPTEDEIDRDMQLLAKQQEKLLNELKKAYEEEAEKSRQDMEDGKQREMEERLRSMNLKFSPEEEEELERLKAVSCTSCQIKKFHVVFDPVDLKYFSL